MICRHCNSQTECACRPNSFPFKNDLSFPNSAGSDNFKKNTVAKSEFGDPTSEIKAFKDSPRTFDSPKLRSIGSDFLRPLKKDMPLVDFILDNDSKLRLIFSIKDHGNSGLVSLEDFSEALKMLENPGLTDSALNHLINITGCKSSNKVRYKVFLESLSKLRPKLGRAKSSRQSDYTANYNKSSVVGIAKQIWAKRVKLTKTSQEGGMRPRIICSASELLGIMKKSEISINIHQLKALLRECGFIQASPLDLIKGIRNLLAEESSDVSVYSQILSETSSWAPIKDENMQMVKSYLKDYNLQEFYRKACRTGGVLEIDDFVEYISSQSRGLVKGFEAEHAFRKASKNKGVLSETEFVSAFRTVENPKKIELSSIDRVKNWLKTNRFSSYQGFNKLLEYGGSVSETLSKDQFVKAVGKLSIQPKEAEFFFKLLDLKNDEKLDLTEWKSKLYEEDFELNEMRDTIMAYGLDPNELLMKMDLKGRSSLSLEEVCKALQRIDPSLSSSKAVEIARSLTGLKPELKVSEFIEKISERPDYNWMSILIEKVRAQSNFDTIKKLFEDADQRVMGKLEASKFAECMEKGGVSLSISDIERLTRSLGRGLNTIDYIEFLTKIRPKTSSASPFTQVLARVLSYFKQNLLRPEDFLLKQGGKIAVKDFAEFLSGKVQKNLSRAQALEFAGVFDKNADGWIDITDLMSSLDFSSDKEEVIEVSSERISQVLAELRGALAKKKLNYQDAFSFFDADKNGLISRSDFHEGLEKLLEIAGPAKEALFSHFDRQKIGLIDFETFAEILRYNDVKTVKTNDSWEWEIGTVEKIKDWAARENVTAEELFRAFDKDFDGSLSKDDLKKSLVEVLKIKETELSPSRVERVFKLLDVHKRGIVQLSDFKVIFEEKRTPEWKDSAKKSLGLFVSKKYASAKAAFSEIVAGSDKITFEKFNNWLGSNNALADYRLTKQLVQEFFAYLDPYKKGYLSSEDWELCLGTFSYSSNCIQELKDVVRSSFCDVKTAFDYFLTFHTGTPPDKISEKDFEKALESLIPQRFSKKEVVAMWKKLFYENSFISFKEFGEAFDSIRYSSSFAPARKLASSRSTVSSVSSKSSLGGDPLKRLQALIRASPYSIEDIFQEMDKDQSGTLSLIEFRNAMRKLNIGLSAKDIDLIMARIDSNNDGQIDWQEFQKQFKSSEAEVQIKSSCQQKLNSLRKHMTAFMLSAKDAFSQFDTQRTGKLSFNDFLALVQRLCELAREPVPGFAVIKDLFDVIDIRKDGVIDMREWLNTFKEAEKSSWEDSKQFEDICKKISKNRKMILDTFEKLGRNGKAEYAQAKEVLGTVVKETVLSEDQWKKIIGVAFKDGLVDYKSLLDIYKQRFTVSQQHPR